MIKNNIKKYRKMAGISQKALHDIAWPGNDNCGRISHYERGYRSPLISDGYIIVDALNSMLDLKITFEEVFPKPKIEKRRKKS